MDEITTISNDVKLNNQTTSPIVLSFRLRIASSFLNIIAAAAPLNLAAATKIKSNENKTELLTRKISIARVFLFFY